MTFDCWQDDLHRWNWQKQSSQKFFAFLSKYFIDCLRRNDLVNTTFINLTKIFIVRFSLSGRLLLFILINNLTPVLCANHSFKRTILPPYNVQNGVFWHCTSLNLLMSPYSSWRSGRIHDWNRDYSSLSTSLLRLLVLLMPLPCSKIRLIEQQHVSSWWWRVSLTKRPTSTRASNSSHHFFCKRFLFLRLNGHITSIFTVQDQKSFSSEKRFLLDFFSRGNWQIFSVDRSVILLVGLHFPENSLMNSRKTCRFQSAIFCKKFISGLWFSFVCANCSVTNGWYPCQSFGLSYTIVAHCTV